MECKRKGRISLLGPFMLSLLMIQDVGIMKEHIVLYYHQGDNFSSLKNS